MKPRSTTQHRQPRLACIIIAVLSAATALAGPFDPPPGYYSSATGTGATLQQQLHNIIDGHTVLSYNNARITLQDTDMDPNAPDSIILVYNRVSLDVSGLISSPGIPGWDSGVSWNREHTWPRSRGVDSSGPDNSDLHQLRPCNPSVNSSRGNLNFGGAFGGSFGSTSDGGTKWHPGEDAGMIARQMFYMETRYDGSDSNTNNLQLVAGNPSSGNQLGDLNRLLEYHYADPPKTFELRRNQVIFEAYQGNRNPFIDHPEFVWSIFAGGNNDSQLSVSTPATDGSSTLIVDLGQVQVNDPAPAPQSITLFKDGADPTYYAVTANGDATASINGRMNAFRENSQSTPLLVGLNASTATPGFQMDTIVIDNLDVDGAGNGMGSLDGDDVITVMFEVVAPSIFPFDDNGDGQVTFDEFETFAGCMAGPSNGAGGVCDNHDSDSDNDVDMDDVANFQVLFTGP